MRPRIGLIYCTRIEKQDRRILPVTHQGIDRASTEINYPGQELERALLFGTTRVRADPPTSHREPNRSVAGPNGRRPLMPLRRRHNTSKFHVGGGASAQLRNCEKLST